MHRNLKRAFNVIPNALRNNSLKVGSARAASTYHEKVVKLPLTHVSTLNNGMRVATEETDAEVATIGVFIDTGSRYETARNNGVGNFLQHLALQGTKKRSQADLEKEINNMGAELHAYNTREITAYYAKCLKGDVPRVVEILSDITQNPALGADEMEKTRSTILEKLDALGTDYEAIVYDLLHSSAYQGTSLAHSIHGPTKNIESMGRPELETFFANQYTPDRMVLAAAGGVQQEQVAALAQKHFGAPKAPAETAFPPYARYTGSEVRCRDDDLPKAYIALGVRTCGWADPDTIPLMVAAELLGEFGKASPASGATSVAMANEFAGRNWLLCDSYKTFSFNYRDTGLFGTYFVADPLELHDAQRVIQCHWMAICETTTEFDVERAKNQLITKLLLARESTTASCQDIGKSVLANSKRQPFEYMDRQLNSLTAATIKDVCLKYFYDKCQVQAGLGKIEGFLDYGYARRCMAWYRA